MRKFRIFSVYLIILILMSSCEREFTSSNNPFDKTPPTISITSPLDSTYIYGEQKILCQAFDQYGVKRIELLLNGKTTGISTGREPYELTWNTNNYNFKNGRYLVSAICTDFNGNYAISDTLVLIVQNGSEFTDVVFREGKFSVSWEKWIDSYFSSYKLYEATNPDMTDAALIFETSDVEMTDYIREDIDLDRLLYYKVITTDSEQSQMSSSVVSGSSYPLIIFNGKNSINSITYDGDWKRTLLNGNDQIGKIEASRQGEIIAFIATSYITSPSTLYAMDKFGENRIEVVRQINNFNISSDGIRITFSHSNSNRIYTVNSDGSDLQKISEETEGTENDPVFSPNTLKIAFGYINNDSSNIYIMNSDGTNRKKLTEDGRGSTPVFSTAGDQLLYGSGDFYNHFFDKLFIVDTDGQNATLLLDSFGSINYYQFTPDGQKVVFSNYKEGIQGIWIMNKDGSDLTSLTSDGSSLKPIVSPDGKKILFMNNYGLIIMDIDGSNYKYLQGHYNFVNQMSFLKQE